MTRWMVTGSSGFIGQRFMRQLKTDDWVLTINTHHHTTPQFEFRGMETVTADITDRTAIETIIGRYQPDIVVAFAAESSVSDSFQRPWSFVNTNIGGPLTIAHAIATQSPHTRMIHISTDEVYGDRRTANHNELLDPRNPYAVTKAAADHMIDVYRRTYDLDAVTIRPTNNWGWGQALPKFIPAALHAKRTGEPMTLHDPSIRRDWLCVDDNVRAIHEIALADARPFDVFNIATHVTASLAEVLERIGDVPHTIGRDRPIADNAYIVDATATWEWLGWTPTVWADDERFDEYVEANT